MCVCVSTLGKIFDTSVLDPWWNRPRSWKDSTFFPEETPDSWKKCVATENKDPGRIEIGNINDGGKITVTREQGSSQETPDSWEKCVATENKDPDRIKVRNINDGDKITVTRERGSDQDTPDSWEKCVATECKDPDRMKIRNIKESIRLLSKSSKDPFRIRSLNNEKYFSGSF